MAEIFKKIKILGSRSCLSIVISLLFIGCLAPLCYGNDEGGVKLGFSILAGSDVRTDTNFTLLALLPRVGWALHKKWEFELEGNFSQYFIHEEKNLYLLGLNCNFLFKPFQWGRMTPFLMAGGGFAYNNNGNGSLGELGDSHVAGVIQGGGGISYNVGKGLWLRGEYRYHHISDPFSRDGGLNSHAIVLGVIF